MKPTRTAAGVTFTSQTGLELSLPSPVMTAAGCFGDGTRFAHADWLQHMGAMVTKSVAPLPRGGPPSPMIIETAAGLLYTAETTGPGIHRTLRDAAPVWARLPVPVIVSVTAETAAEFSAMAIELETVPGVVALELNPTDAERAGSTAGSTTRQIAELVEIVTAASSLPLVVKLPFTTDIRDRALAAEAGGAVAVTVGHGWPASWFMPSGPHSSLLRVPGFLAGPATLPLALDVVAEVAAALQIGVIGCGGIADVEAARQHLAAGAGAVQVGSALFRDPSLAAAVAVELATDGAVSIAP